MTNTCNRCERDMPLLFGVKKQQVCHECISATGPALIWLSNEVIKLKEGLTLLRDCKTYLAGHGVSLVKDIDDFLAQFDSHPPEQEGKK